MSFKSGYVNILGNPNAGKSTLMNKLLGQALSITNAKAQTTRHRILGILNGENYQMVFSDTPGIIIPAYKLHQSMMKVVNEALIDADIILLVIDATNDTPLPENALEKIKNAKVPVYVLINKIDLLDEKALEDIVARNKREFPNSDIIPISAKTGFGAKLLLDLLLKNLPENPPYFDQNDLTDRTTRFFVSEIIRGNILKYYDKEIPYSVEVVVESYEELPNIDKINCNIIVSRDSQKGIIIGNQGKAIKQLGIKSRREIEGFLGKKIFLGLFVKVDKDWRENPRALKNFGYED
ncbi:MAG: GTPase Era [Bacteroidota bacterium]|jgi:GTP-binding protein Era